ncbi:MAG: GatB/YqeY domain-containing protein, partial [Patescibacteria group bacterium]
MSLREKIQSEIKTAMQEKEAQKLSVLRMVLAAVLNKEKEKRAKLSKEEQDESKLGELSKLNNDEVLEVISSEAKKRKDSIEQFKKGNRHDLADQEKSELKILEEYLPEQMGEDEVRKIIIEKIQELGASGLQDTGKIMGAIMGQLKGKADGCLVN